MAGDEVAQQALLDESLKKSALVWLVVDGRTHGRWHSWLDGHLYLLTGPGEQPDPGLLAGSRTRILVRSKDDGRHLLTVDADTSVLQPTDADWATATADLAKLRLNLSHPAEAAARWAAPDFTIYRLTPRLPLVESPDDLPDDARRLTPALTSATTSSPRPRVLHRRGGSGRPLS